VLLPLMMHTVGAPVAPVMKSVTVQAIVSFAWHVSGMLVVGSRSHSAYIVCGEIMVPGGDSKGLSVASSIQNGVVVTSHCKVASVGHPKFVVALPTGPVGCVAQDVYVPSLYLHCFISSPGLHELAHVGFIQFASHWTRVSSGQSL